MAQPRLYGHEEAWVWVLALRGNDSKSKQM